jgi:beta-glucosidase
VVDAWKRPADATPEGAVALTAGQTHAITVEAWQDSDRGDQRLTWSRPSQGAEAAVAAAKDADLVLFVGGLTAKLEGEEMSVRAPGFAGGDRTRIDLPAPQQALLENLHATGKPVVLVLMNGSAMAVNWADEKLPAIVEAWYPGGEGGHAVAGLIAGDYSPSGRLPLTFYRSADQLPPFKDYGMARRTYRYFPGEALYPFGHGLSFTSFKYGQPKMARSVKAGEGLKVSVDVTNVGVRDGDEVAQLYVSRGAVGAPIRSLKGFQRVALEPGETKTLTFELDPSALSVVDAAGGRAIDAGPADLWIGGGQPVSRPGLAKPAGVSARVAVTGRKVLP